MFVTQKCESDSRFCERKIERDKGGNHIKINSRNLPSNYNSPQKRTAINM